MIRKIIQIDQDKCNGCGACAAACHEGAIEMINGKACLTREDYCDGLGDCLPACPTGAITFTEREAPAYDEAAVQRAKFQKTGGSSPCGCPSARPATIRAEKSSASAMHGSLPGQLMQWPCQIKLVPVHAPYLNGADLLIAADCTAYAYGNFHQDFMRGHITLIGCPKLDEGDYAAKLAQIIAENDVRSIRVARMEVPCCGGLENAVKRALLSVGKSIPLQVITVTTNGNIQESVLEIP